MLRVKGSGGLVVVAEVGGASDGTIMCRASSYEETIVDVSCQKKRAGAGVASERNYFRIWWRFRFP